MLDNDIVMHINQRIWPSIINHKRMWCVCTHPSRSDIIGILF